MSRCGKGNQAEVNKKVKTFQANMLKKYIERADQDRAPQQNLNNNQAMSCDVCTRIIGGNENLSENDNENNLEKIRMARRPTTKKEGRSFLGLVKDYHTHICSTLDKGQPNKIQWGQAQEKAFSSL